jgi:hypothetical protein
VALHKSSRSNLPTEKDIKELGGKGGYCHRRIQKGIRQDRCPTPNFSISSSTKSANACAGSEFEKQVIGTTPVVPPGALAFTRIFPILDTVGVTGSNPVCAPVVKPLLLGARFYFGCCTGPMSGVRTGLANP